MRSVRARLAIAVLATAATAGLSVGASSASATTSTATAAKRSIIVQGVTVAYKVGSTIGGNGATQFTVSAQIATGGGTGLCDAYWYRHEYSTGSYTYLGDHTSPFIDTALPGHYYAYYVAAYDCFGNVDVYEQDFSYFGIDDENYHFYNFYKTWSHPYVNGAYAGRVYRSNQVNASTYWSRGYWANFALIANTPSVGKVKVYVDGALKATVTLRRTARNLVYKYGTGVSAYHDVRFVVASGTVQIDAMLYRYN